MTDRPDPKLADLTLTLSRTLIGHKFIRPNPDGADLELELVSAERTARDPGSDPAAERPFSLLFRGPHELHLTQGCHDLRHPTHPLPRIFLVPIGDDDRGPRYEAVFT